jgi:20S proteasome subunit beta 7
MDDFPTSRSQSGPIVTGASVLAVKYKDGIMMAADNLGAFSVFPL